MQCFDMNEEKQEQITSDYTGAYKREESFDLRKRIVELRELILRKSIEEHSVVPRILHLFRLLFLCDQLSKSRTNLVNSQPLT